MEVKFALLADFASKTDNGKLNIMGIFDELTPPAIPYAHPQMFLVVQYEASVAESGATRRFQTRLLDADGTQMFAVSQEMVVPEAKHARRPSVAQIIGLNGLRFEHAGDYQFSVLVDEDEKHSVGLAVSPPSEKRGVE